MHIIVSVTISQRSKCLEMTLYVNIHVQLSTSDTFLWSVAKVDIFKSDVRNIMPLPNPLSRSTTKWMCQTLQSESVAVGRPRMGIDVHHKSLEKLLWYKERQYSWSHPAKVSWFWALHSQWPSVPTVAASNVFSRALTPFLLVTSLLLCDCFNTPYKQGWF